MSVATHCSRHGAASTAIRPARVRGKHVNPNCAGMKRRRARLTTTCATRSRSMNGKSCSRSIRRSCASANTVMANASIAVPRSATRGLPPHPTRRAALRARQNSNGAAPRPEQEGAMFKRILVAIDGSETSRHALDAALTLAQDSDASLRVVYVLTNPPVYWDSPGYDPSIMRTALTEEGAMLNAGATDLMRKHGVHGDTQIVDAGAMGDIPTFIISAAHDYQAQ